MILSNRVPNRVWDEAMGTTRFPPESWRGGGGGLGHYGEASVVASEVMSDVLQALSLAAMELEAQAYVRYDLPETTRSPALDAVIRAKEGQTQLSNNGRAEVQAGSMTLQAWLDAAAANAEALKAIAPVFGSETDVNPFLDQVITAARGTPLGGNSPWLLIGGGLGLGFLAYQLFLK